MFGGSSTDPEDQLAELDYMYQRLADNLAGLSRQAPGWTGQVVSRRYGPAQAPEDITPTVDEVMAAETRMRELNVALQHWSTVVDEFRTSKEVIKAGYMAATGLAEGQRSVLAASDTSDAERASAEAQLEGAEQQKAKALAALARLLARAAAIRRGLAQAAIDPAGRQATGPLDLPEGLLELHADPLGSDARILFAVEPAGTITLLAVLDSAAAVHRHRDAAVDLACSLLVEIRDQGWPQPQEDAEPDELTFADSGAFLLRYFPDEVAAITARATVLAGARRLVGVRREHGLSASVLARRSGLSLEQVAGIELGGLRQATVADAAAYIAGLGGRLHLIADLGPGEQTEISG
jgi:hypothetical protein